MADTKISALTTVTPATRTTSDWLAGARATSSNFKLDASLLGVYRRAQGLTVYATRALAMSGKADSAASLQTQLTALNVAGGGVLLLDPGWYYMATYITIPANVTLKGHGKTVTNLVVALTADYTSDGDAYGLVLFSATHDAAIEDLTIDCSSTAGQNGIVFKATDLQAEANTITYGTAVSASTHFSKGERVTCGTATATVEKAVPSSATAGTLWLYDVVGTFATATAITGNKVGSANTTSVLTNPNSYRCAARRVEVLGQAMSVSQYLIWVQNCVDIDVIECTVNGNGITETGAHEWYNTSIGGNGDTSVDQEGIEIRGGRRCRVLNNTCINMTGPGIGWPAVDEAWENDIVEGICTGNTVDRCGYGIYINSCYSTANGVKGVRSLVVANNTITNPWLSGIFIEHGGVQTLPLTLAYDTQTGNFAAGLIVTGTWSKTTATIVSDSDSGASGTLTLTNIVGRFIDNEPLADTATGAALVNSPTNKVGTETVMRGIIIEGNTVDCTGSVRDANHAQHALYVNLNDPSAAKLRYAGCCIKNNTFLGGGATANITEANYIIQAHDWVIEGNTFDNCMASNTTYAVFVGACTNLKFDKNILSRSRKSALACQTNVNLSLRGNRFFQWQMAGGGSPCVRLDTTNNIVHFMDNEFDMTGCLLYSYALSGDGSTTGMRYGGNTFVGMGGIGILGEGAAWADESATASGGTLTHYQGKVVPGNGASAATFSCDKVFTSSTRIFIQQVGGVGQGIGHSQVFKVTHPSNGQFIITNYVDGSAANFAAADAFDYQIVN